MKKKTNKVLYVFLLAFIILSFYYQNIQKNKGYTYYDEASGGVCKSYFCDYFIRGKFRIGVWQRFYAYDQPMLGNYLYGLVLYPKYLYDKFTGDADIDYLQWLTSQGFYCIDEDLYPRHDTTILIDKDNNISPLGVGETGTKEELIKKHGSGISGYLDVISQARRINIFLLALSVLIFAYLVFLIAGLNASVIFILLYGFNNTLINNSLYAHSEALFIFLLNGYVLSLFSFITGKIGKWFLAASLFSGLLISTKLNGLMSILIFPLLYGYSKIICNEFNVKGLLQTMKKSLQLILISFSIFILLNPFTWKNPLIRTIFMYQHRQNTIEFQKHIFPKYAILNYGESVNLLYQNYFSNSGFNSVGSNIPLTNKGLFWLALFIYGIINIAKSLIKNSNFNISYIPLTFFFILMITLAYLGINWPRYYIHLTAFIVYIEVIGLLDVMRKFRMFFRKP